MNTNITDAPLLSQSSVSWFTHLYNYKYVIIGVIIIVVTIYMFKRKGNNNIITKCFNFTDKENETNDIDYLVLHNKQLHNVSPKFFEKLIKSLDPSKILNSTMDTFKSSTAPSSHINKTDENINISDIIDT